MASVERSVALDPAVVEAVTAELAVRRESFVDNLVAITRLEVEGLDHADDLAQWLVASIAENTAVLIEVLRTRDEPRAAGVPPAAMDYAVRLARADVPISALLRAYRFGQASFTQLCLDVAEDLEIHDLKTLRTIVDEVAAFIDHVCEEVGRAYDREAARIIRTPGALRQHWVQQVLTDDTLDSAAAEAALGYALSGRQLAVEIWTDAAERHLSADQLDKVVALIGAEFGEASSVSTIVGEFAARTWFAVADDVTIDQAHLVASLRAGGHRVRLAFGLPLDDVAGFRRSHTQAVRTRELATVLDDRPPTVTTYAEVAPVALLRDDPVELREFVRRTLGALAADDDRTRGLRETLRVFLDANRMHDRAARRLMVHRNTVRYRIDQAVSMRGKTLDADPLDLMLALAAAKWLGPAVLS